MEENKKKYEEEIDFKALTKNPKRLFGWVFPYFFGILLVLGIFYVHNINTISLNTVPVNTPEEDLVKRTLDMKKGSVSEPVDLALLQNPTQELINKGQELYTANCSSCHGNEGLGDGAAGAALNPPPRNYMDTEGWTNGRTFYDMYKTLEEGIIENGMAAYEYLPPIDRIAMIHYTRTFAQFPEVTGDEVQEIEAEYKLSEGKQTANQIPVDLAIQKLIEEKGETQELSNLVDFVYNHPNIEGADVFKTVAVNKKRVLSSFFASNINEMSLEQFVTTVQSSPVEIGFSASVTSLDQNEWTSLFNYIKSVLETAQS